MIPGSRLSAFLTVVIAMTLFLSTLATAFATAEADPFQNTWMRTDKAVHDGVVSRTWMWGPMDTAHDAMEPYAEAHEGQRMVMYFDKSRMEINDPLGDRNDPWHVTNGLLVIELMTGQRQLGDATFEPHQPAAIAVAGDLDDPNGPTYASLASLRSAAPYAAGHTIVSRVNSAGVVSQDQSLASYGVTAAERVTVPGIDHRVASVFWQFMNSSGTVWDDGFVTAPLFSNPYYATGFPITEAYWTTVEVAGTPRDVLLQCFERRCLTFTPGNPIGWRVEAGNVGLHYVMWRYGVSGATTTATIFMVALGDDGASGMPVGCEDSLIPVLRPVLATHDPAQRVEFALNALFAVQDQWYGESGLYNALHQSSLTIDSVNVVGGTATVMLSGTASYGGVCDEPRLAEQIRQTVLNVPGITAAVVTLNGNPL
ncbi:MAG TPA: GerMN domain-containing protein [Thermomicrobiales bacterium]|nr:GerMN domain-containing protein [Thermomicrobiales bacterium]